MTPREGKRHQLEVLLIIRLVFEAADWCGLLGGKGGSTECFVGCASAAAAVSQQAASMVLARRCTIRRGARRRQFGAVKGSA